MTFQMESLRRSSGALPKREDTAKASVTSQEAVSLVCSYYGGEEEQGDMCRICHSGNSIGEPLVSPCGCSGSVKYVHETCLQRWLLRDTATPICASSSAAAAAAAAYRCELCGSNFQLTAQSKPFRQWKKLDMTAAERRKVACSAAFHIVAVACVAWSLYVLIERTVEEAREGGEGGNGLHWPFWTKLAVVIVGLAGATAFMYIQCKAYLQLIARWRAFNRVIHVHARSQPVTSAHCAEELLLIRGRAAVEACNGTRGHGSGDTAPAAV